MTERSPYEIRHRSDGEAISAARGLAKFEGLFVGFSAGANVAAAIKLGSRMTEHEVVVTVLPDSGMRYLSTDLFE